MRWIDDDTFEVDWFATSIDDLTWTLRFRELEDSNGDPLEILGVTKGDSGFDDDPSVDFTFDSVTLSYSNIIDPESGDFRSFDLALPEPSLGSALLLGTLMLTRFRHRSCPFERGAVGGGVRPRSVAQPDA